MRALPQWWYEGAACAGMNPNLFFPDFDSLVEEKAIITCGSCIIRERCLQWAIDNDEWGVWGGLTETDRRNLDVHRSRAKCPACKSTRLLEDRGTETCLACGLCWSI